jgi:hypothetical protein
VRLEHLHIPVEPPDHFITALDAKRAAWQEVALHIHDDQCVSRAQIEMLGR